ncbi:MAG: hypothetical protein P8186_30730 [Anaerolineae bacterium]|jgi:hypothetical protein
MNELAISNMTIIRRNFRLASVRAAIFILVVLLVGCSPTSLPPSEVGKGSSKEDVIASLGEPDQTQDFILPDEPFFGPQESLVNLVPAGTVIEEWVYEIGDEVLYVWFTGEDDDLREDWLVLVTARYPKDAVY